MQPTYRGDGTPDRTGSLFLCQELPGPRSPLIPTPPDGPSSSETDSLFRPLMPLDFK